MHPDEPLGAFRQLKTLCEDAGYEHGVILFHGFELEAYYYLYLSGCIKLSEWPEKILSIAYRIISDYGRNLMLPFFWIAVFIMAGSLVNAELTHDFLWGLSVGYVPLKCSLRNSLGPMIFALPDNGKYFCDGVAENLAGHTLHFFQIVTTSIIWFLIVFMARRRFKL